MPVPRFEGFGQLGNRLPLVALGLVVGSELKLHPARLTWSRRRRPEKNGGNTEADRVPFGLDRAGPQVTFPALFDEILYPPRTDL